MYTQHIYLFRTCIGFWFEILGFIFVLSKLSIDFRIGYYSSDTIAYILVLVGFDEAPVRIDCEVLAAEKNFDIASISLIFGFHTPNFEFCLLK